MTQKPTGIFKVPLFPLPGVVLFPGAVVPLRVFEPRYLKLLEDVLASNRQMGLAHLKPASFVHDKAEEAGAPPEIFPVLGVGIVIAQEKLEDGTWHIALLGKSRCRVREEIPHEPYRIATVEIVKDRPPASAQDQSALRKELRVLRGLGRDLVGRTLEGEPRQHLTRLLCEGSDGGSVTDLLASMYAQDAALRQTLLESTELLDRVRLLKPVLERHLARAARQIPLPPFDSQDVCLN